MSVNSPEACVIDMWASAFLASGYSFASGTTILTAVSQGYQVGVPNYYRAGSNIYLFGVRFAPYSFDKMSLRFDVEVGAIPPTGAPSGSYYLFYGAGLRRLIVYTLYDIGQLLTTLAQLVQAVVMLSMAIDVLTGGGGSQGLLSLLGLGTGQQQGQQGQG